MNIKCDKIEGEWNYNTCAGCNHFSVSIPLGKARAWRCSLNNRTAAEKRAFHIIWVECYLINVGRLSEENRSPITVVFINKTNKKGKKKCHKEKN